MYFLKASWRHCSLAGLNDIGFVPALGSTEASSQPDLLLQLAPTLPLLKEIYSGGENRKYVSGPSSESISQQKIQISVVFPVLLSLTSSSQAGETLLCASLRRSEARGDQS